MNGKARDGRPEEHHEYGGVPVENDLVRWLRRGGEAIRPHLTTIAAVAAALLVLWGYFSWRRATADARRSAAWNEFFAEDYDAVITKYQDTEALPYARMRVAESAMQDAKKNLLAKRSDAVRSFEKAEQQYDAVAGDPNAPADIRRNAMLMKALALETSGAPEKAKEQYTKLVNQYRDSPEARAADARAKELSKKSAVDFYRQLANYKPGERPTTQPSLDDLLKGSANPNPNNMLPSPPPVTKGDGKSGEKKEAIPSPPPLKRAPPAPAPGKDLPENEKPPAKDAAKDAKATATKDAKSPPAKPAEPPKK